jgi:hypothetical protein
MAEGSSRRPYSDTVVVPAVLVLPGDPEPTEWLASHPGAARLPARVVRRARKPANDQDTQTDRAASTAPAPDAGKASGEPDQPASASRLDAKQYPPPGPGPSGLEAPARDAVASYLRINGVLEGMLAGSEPAQPVPKSTATDGAARGPHVDPDPAP